MVDEFVDIDIDSAAKQQSKKTQDRPWSPSLMMRANSKHPDPDPANLKHEAAAKTKLFVPN